MAVPKTVAEIKYPVTEDIPVLFEDPDMNMSLTHEFLYSDSLKEYRKAFAVCSTGIEQDKILEQVILVSQPGVIRKAPLRLRIELLDCQNQMELSSLRPVARLSNRSSISYILCSLSLYESIMSLCMLSSDMAN